MSFYKKKDITFGAWGSSIFESTMFYVSFRYYIKNNVFFRLLVELQIWCRDQLHWCVLWHSVVPSGRYWNSTLKQHVTTCIFLPVHHSVPYCLMKYSEYEKANQIVCGHLIWVEKSDNWMMNENVLITFSKSMIHFIVLILTQCSRILKLIIAQLL